MNADELIAGRQLAAVDFEAEGYDQNGENLFVQEIDKANLITSRMPYTMFPPPGGMHKPVIDIDLPARLVPSSTPGHFHLYFDVPVRWDAYVKVLEALRDAGLVERGYVAASIARGYTAVRPPWVRK